MYVVRNLQRVAPYPGAVSSEYHRFPLDMSTVCLILCDVLSDMNSGARPWLSTVVDRLIFTS